ncbi:IS110 family transposase [Paenibacillus whitsoniae]|uniref:IS110 family transposase n=1 Tax=Paenibacillus whitsoniae TaxID=2496558 RepID=A0A430JJJ4_9BACL|nr:IS110 family transposase [Paenibacillus whitsoniae]RTE11192.1 IS110 family transposase [Paenibacillus whitsoniae]
MHPKQRHIYIGVDIHKNTHTAVILNCWHEKLAAIEFDNKPAAFPSLMMCVNKHLGEGLTPVFGLEDVGGNGRTLAVFLVEQQYRVKEINPALSSLKRKSYPMTKKNDHWDAECVAKLLLDEWDVLPDAKPQDNYWILSQLVLRRDALAKRVVVLKNQLHAQLSYHYPSYRTFFSEIDGDAAMMFWETYPCPAVLEGVSETELQVELRKHSRSLSNEKAAFILRCVQADGVVKREYQSEHNFLIRSHVRELKECQSELTKVDGRIAERMKAFGYKLNTMTGIDNVTAAAFVAEIGDVQRFQSADKLAKYAGVAPITFGSGGQSKDLVSKQGNRQLHSLFWSLAIRQVHVSRTGKATNPVFLAYYLRKQQEGKSKKGALVCIMRRLVNIIYGMMKNKTAYVIGNVPEKEVA